MRIQLAKKDSVMKHTLTKQFEGVASIYRGYSTIVTEVAGFNYAFATDTLVYSLAISNHRLVTGYKFFSSPFWFAVVFLCL